jgi:hypothetical protein
MRNREIGGSPSSGDRKAFTAKDAKDAKEIGDKKTKPTAGKPGALLREDLAAGQFSIATFGLLFWFSDLARLPDLPQALLRHDDRFLRRERLAGIGGHGYQQSFFAINQVAGIERRQFKAMAVGDGVSGAGFNAIAAEDAAVVVDVIDLGVAFGATDAVLFGVFGRLNVNAVRGASGRTQETGHALLQAVFIALQLMQSAKAFLKNRALIGQFFIGIILNNGGRKHLPQGYGHSFGDAS